MTVHVLMPVFNRLPLTQSMLACLRSQCLDEPLSIIVINDGSTDGTDEYLRGQANVTVLYGDGSLWWGGAIDLGLRHVFNQASVEDWVLFVNNDTSIEPGFVQALLDAARSHAPAAVGSVIRDIEPPHRLLSLGPRIDPWRFRVRDAICDTDTIFEGGVLSVDALSGRGAMYPVAALLQAGGMRARWLPHYLADYEVALRVRYAGWTLLVNTAAVVFSKNEYGNAYCPAGLWARLFSVRSPSFLPARLGFWWAASSLFQRLTFPLRAVVLILIAMGRRKA